jgi:3-oxoacyl-[acyl-carrier-protein] synthase-3
MVPDILSIPPTFQKKVMTIHSKIVSVASYLPERTFKMSEIEKRIQVSSEADHLPVAAIRRLTGVETVYHRNEGVDASDLAVHAGRTALQRAGLDIADIDLLIFASASQDLVEPATSHIISSKLGGKMPVMDVKNACNSFLNGMQVADALIKTGSYKKVLIVSGEVPTGAIRWNNRSRDEFNRSFPGFSMSDAGAGMVLSVSDKPGIHHIGFSANSDKWDVGMLETGGSRAVRDLDATYFNIDGHRLQEAFLELGPEIIEKTLAVTGKTWEDFAFVAVHQVSAVYMQDIMNILQLPRELIIETVRTHGNMASASMPLQLELAIEQGRVKEGDNFAFIGFGGGISTGMGVFTL